MKILYLNNYYYPRGGAENVFLNEAYIMKNKGHTVHFFSRKHPCNFTSELSNLFPDQMETDSVKFGKRSFQILPKIFYNLEAKNGLRIALDKTKIDLAHAHNIYGGLTTAVLDLLNEKCVPTVMTLHDYKLICPNYKLMHHGRICEDCKGHKYFMAIKNICHKESFIASTIYSLETYFNFITNKYKKNVHKFISPSKFLKNKFIEFGWPSTKIEYIPNFVDITTFKPNFTPGNYFLYIGRLSIEKGVSTLISAFKKIKNKNTKLYIVGNGPLKNELESFSQNDPRITFTGYLSGKKLKVITQNSLAVVVPSEWYENAPLSVLEAFSYGKPVIGSNVGGIPEMIEDGNNGFHFQSRDVNGLKGKLELILGLLDKQVVEMGKAARLTVEKKYSPEFHYERLNQIYCEAQKQK